eukprot:COSAG01_NODE_1305_length_10807_cov_3.074897_7_plen_210_part_00
MGGCGCGCGCVCVSLHTRCCSQKSPRVHSLPLGFASAPTHAVSSNRRRVIAAAAVPAAAVVALPWVATRPRALGAAVAQPPCVAPARGSSRATGPDGSRRYPVPPAPAVPGGAALHPPPPCPDTPPEQGAACLSVGRGVLVSWAGRACQLGGACLSVGRGGGAGRPFLSLAHLLSAGGLRVSPPPSSTSGRIPSSVPPAGWAASARAGC